MSKNNNPFSKKEYHLADGLVGSGRGQIDHSFMNEPLLSASSPKCIVCSGIPSFKIIPKHDSVATIEIDTEGYLCDACAKNKVLDPKLFGLRLIK